MILIGQLTRTIDSDARVENSDLEEVEVREYATIHDSSISKGSRIYERATIKKCKIGKDVDVNAGAYLENVEVGEKVQFGPNSNVVGVTHNLTEEGMEHRNDVFKEIKIGENSFVGAGATILPGIKIGKTLL
ncbi:MAG: DapH/DapD/GlmU-related protein [Candidatus Nanohalobium sp.]